MTQVQARKLATLVAKTSDNVVVKFGITNGAHVLHLINTKLRRSLTIRSSIEWDLHEWNKVGF